MSSAIPGVVEVIDEVLLRHYRIAASKTASGTYATLRAQILSSLADEVIQVWNLHDWRFRYIDDDITIPAAGGSDDGYTGELPGDWSNEGRQGGVWLADPDRGQLRWKRRQEVIDLQRTYPDITGIPEWYTVTGTDTLSVYPKQIANRTLHVSYEQAAPNLTDSATDSGGLEAFPAQWIRSVLLSGTILREMLRKGRSELAAAQAEMYKNALFTMVCQERQGKPWEDVLPRFAGSSDVYMDWF